MNAYILETTINPEIPGVKLSQTFDPEVCRQYLPPEARNPEGQSHYCFVYPQFDPNYVAGALQPYLIWKVDDIDCFAGVSDCHFYNQLLHLAEASGGVVGFDVTAMSSAGTFTWAVTESYLNMYVMPPLYCTGTADYPYRH